jgi:IclR family pca regulon transcriptional regulator
MDGQSSRDLVGSLQRGLQVIEILARETAGLTLTETAAKTALTRAGARRLLITLVAAGYAVQDGRRFSLSPRLLTLARSWLQGMSLWTYAEPFMRDVAAQFNESCSAAVLSGEDVVYVARVPGRTILNVALHVGTRLPACYTSMGRVLLSGLPEEELRGILVTVRTEQKTPKSIVDRKRLEAEIRKAGAAGFAIVDEELEMGLRSIAVPVRDGAGRVSAAINVSTQSSRFTTKEMERRMLPRLLVAALAIEDFFVVQ